MKKKKEPREFYVLLRCNGYTAETLNWAGYGKNGVYVNKYKPEEGDRVIKVREVFKKKSKKTKRK